MRCVYFMFVPVICILFLSFTLAGLYTVQPGEAKYFNSQSIKEILNLPLNEYESNGEKHKFLKFEDFLSVVNKSISEAAKAVKSA